jgi:argininosuccinate lyase
VSKLWGGRFGKATHRAVEDFTHSFAIDSRLWEADLRGSIAHARMLGKVGVISLVEASTLVEGLESVQQDLVDGKAQLQPLAEDIHSEIERLLGERVGDVAGKLHTARSRNDQVATATRLYLRDQIGDLQGEVRALQAWIVEAAESHLETLMPGFTHLQHAQPISLAHHILAYFWMLERDYSRLVDCKRRMNAMPLGSAALAGTSFPLDRAMTASELKFDEICQNSLDAVSDRDFVVEFLSGASLIVTHLSRLAEELILWSTPEFGFVELDDQVTTGSSIMPQKKNPDCAELIRGRVGRVNGALIGALTLLKALPLSYNRDLQEDKTFLFEGLDTTRASLRIMLLMLQGARFNVDRMAVSLAGDFSNATDLADYLVRQGLTFRQSHEIVGRTVRFCIEHEIGLENMTVAQLESFSPKIGPEVLPLLKHHSVMAARISAGGTGPDSVRNQLIEAKNRLTH